MPEDETEPRRPARWSIDTIVPVVILPVVLVVAIVYLTGIVLHLFVHV